SGLNLPRAYGTRSRPPLNVQAVGLTWAAGVNGSLRKLLPGRGAQQPQHRRGGAEPTRVGGLAGDPACSHQKAVMAQLPFLARVSSSSTRSMHHGGDPTAHATFQGERRPISSAVTRRSPLARFDARSVFATFQRNYALYNI